MPGDEPEAGDGPSDPGRAAHAPLEPAHRPGALAGQDDAALPAAAQQIVDAVGSPDRDQVEHAAAADVDRSWRAGAPRGRPPRPRAGRARRARARIPLGEARAKGGDLVGGIAARGRQQADPRSRRRATSPSRWSRIASLPRRRENSCPPSARIERSASGTGPGRGPTPPSPTRGPGPRLRRISGTAVPVSQVARRELRGDRRAVAELDPVGASVRARGDDLAEVVADEVQRRAVVGRVGGRHPVAAATRTAPRGAAGSLE